MKDTDDIYRDLEEKPVEDLKDSDDRDAKSKAVNTAQVSYEHLHGVARITVVHSSKLSSTSFSVSS